MSAPGIIEREAQCIDYSFLSIKTSKALETLLAGRPLSEEDRAVLSKAVRFLEAIANGAAFVTTGNYQNEADPLDSVTALNYAMQSIEQLQQLLANDDIAQFFRDVAITLGQSTNHPHPLTEEEIQKLLFAIQFFQVLYDILTAQLKQISNDEVLDRRTVANAA